MAEIINRKLVLEDGSEYLGYAFGSTEDRVFEIVFNTAMVGYQEILSDPSYTDQMVVMTYPVIGNYGIADEDFESKIPTIGGLAVREYTDSPSNFRYTRTLAEIMEEYHIPGIAGIDTRKLTRTIRDGGTQRALITSVDTTIQEAQKIIQNTPISNDAVARVSCKKRWYSRTPNARYNVVAVDCGIRYNIIRSLNKRGINVTIVPYDISAAEIFKMKPDGIFLSNGPGNPEDVKPVINLVKELRGHFPIFGICLGHQLISLAYGATTYKLKFGHRGGNHPVKNLLNGRIEITSQNHSYAVSLESLKNTDLTLTHQNLLDQTVEGVMCQKDKVFSVQFYPESAPDHQDSAYLFDAFIDRMKEAKDNA